jgi:hypothetical protein
MKSIYDMKARLNLTFSMEWRVNSCEKLNAPVN